MISDAIEPGTFNGDDARRTFLPPFRYWLRPVAKAFSIVAAEPLASTVIRSGETPETVRPCERR